MKHQPIAERHAYHRVSPPDAAIPDEASKETVPGGPVENKQSIPALTKSYWVGDLLQDLDECSCRSTRDKRVGEARMYLLFRDALRTSSW